MKDNFAINSSTLIEMEEVFIATRSKFIYVDEIRERIDAPNIFSDIILETDDEDEDDPVAQLADISVQSRLSGATIPTLEQGYLLSDWAAMLKGESGLLLWTDMSPY